MSGDGVTLDPHVIAAIAWVADGGEVNVAALCRSARISRKTFYKYLTRYRAEGPAGFVARSTTPRRSPTRTSVTLEEQIVRARKELLDAGWDGGAASIRGHLSAHGLEPAPSVSTIHRVLVRRGQVVPAPAKRPRTTYQRFERETANDLWQMDGFEVRLADGSTVVVIQILDDHTRMDLACQVSAQETGQAAWDALTSAIERYGYPRQLLTDNSTAFNAERRGWASHLALACRTIGIEPITSRPHHPQTCGKNERAHQTVRRWLARRPAAATAADLQHLLEQYRYSYNNDRPHQGIDGLTPRQRWDRGRPAPSPEGPLTGPDLPLIMARYTVSDTGVIVIARRSIRLSSQLAGRIAVTFRQGDDITIFIGPRLFGTHTLDHTRRYQRLDNPVLPMS